MVGKFENYLKNSELEASWAVIYYGFQIISSVILLFLLSLFSNSNFVDTNRFPASYSALMFYAFIIIFTVFIIWKKGPWSIPTSYVRFSLFYFIPFWLLNGFSAMIIPKKYQNIDGFIIEEYDFENSKIHISLATNFLNKSK